MDGHATPRSGAAPAAGRTRRIRNTFSRADNVYFTSATLFSLCRYGFSFDMLPVASMEMLLDYCVQYTISRSHLVHELKFRSLIFSLADQLRYPEV